MAGTAVVIGYGLYRRELPWLFVRDRCESLVVRFDPFACLLGTCAGRRRRRHWGAMSQSWKDSRLAALAGDLTVVSSPPSPSATPEDRVPAPKSEDHSVTAVGSSSSPGISSKVKGATSLAYREARDYQRAVASQISSKGRRLDFSTKSAEDGCVLPVRKVFQHVSRFEKIKGAVHALAFFALLTIFNTIRFDADYASDTLAIFRDGRDDGFPGVWESEDFYCDSDGNGDFFDEHAGEACQVRWRDVGEVNDMVGYLESIMVSLPSAVGEACPTCGVAITSAASMMSSVTIHDFICSDFEISSQEAGSNVASTAIGKLKDTCYGEGLAIGGQEAVDTVWASNPSTKSAPCCNNSTLIEDSLILVTMSQATPGNEDVSLPLEFFANMSHAQRRTYIEQFALQNINGNQNFMQILVSRGQRVTGISYGATFVDAGCFDEHFDQRWAAAQASNQRHYDANVQLPDCYSAELVLPTQSFWSYRFDMHGYEVGMWTFIVILLVLDW